MNNLYGALIFLCVLLQSSLVSVPLCIPVLFVWYVFAKSNVPFVVGFLVGIILDSISMHALGTTSALISALLGFVYLYERKFEVQTPQFIGVSVFFATIAYGLFLTGQLLLIHGVFNAIFGLVLFAGTYRFFPAKELSS